MSAAHARGLTRLPEELVDLVCAFVVDFDVKYAIKTLCSLALTSRRLFEPAGRALWHDPSRILATRDAHSAHIFLGRVIRNPALGAHLKRLEGVVDMFICVPALSLDHDYPVVFTNWAFTLLQYCSNVTGLSVWPDPEADWLGQLEHLPRLRHLTVQARHPPVYFDDDDFFSYFNFLAGASAVRLDSLTLRDYYGPRGHTRWAVHLPVTRLELDRYGPQLDEDLIWGPEEWGELFAEPRRFTNLRVVVLANVEIDVSGFEQLCAAAPTLERVDPRHGLWQACKCPGGTCPAASCPDASMDVRLAEALPILPELRFLHIGELLCRGDAILTGALGHPLWPHWQLHRLRINDNGSSITSSSFTSSSRAPSVPAVPSAAPSSPGTFPRYVDAPASPSHLEPGFEARDDSDDEALEADGGYGSDCDVDEADRQWKEYDDEGLWECARERFED
ncbi:hypothetical protein DMC30DRAFT_420118 [Rhodotorula diobovata]|uniref:F-box domain-containing protein n=1 Tax=Rhodotorula diobovata TaxID=5288 RepID=A0A5C5FJW5_9BASI|nr:hypothetical protein DMC30DRAFT_420118 [Rhodotorula diobovata]